MNRKLRSIIRHEYLTIVKQPAFILTMLGVPMLMIAVGALMFFSERTAESSLDDITEDISEVVVIDKSGLIDEDIVASLEFELRDSGEAEVIQQVRSQELDGAIIYPEDVLETRSFEAYIDRGDNLMAPSVISDIGEELLGASLAALLEDTNIATVLQQGSVGQVTAYQDGEETLGMAEYIVPGAFLALFFIILFFTMSYMLLGVAEEKENRSMEMVLSYVKPRTLMSGKLLSIGLVGLTQMLFFPTLGVLAYFSVTRYQNQLSMPLNIDFTTLVFDPISIIIGFLVLIFGFLMFAALMSGVAAMMPGVKEANSFSSVFFLIPLVPVYAFPILMAAPESFLVKFLTFFPLTSPPVLLVRNTLGNIGIYEAAAAVLTLAVFTILAFMLAAKLFRLGALEFSDRLKLSSLFK